MTEPKFCTFEPIEAGGYRCRECEFPWPRPLKRNCQPMKPGLVAVTKPITKAPHYLTRWMMRQRPGTFIWQTFERWGVHHRMQMFAPTKGCGCSARRFWLDDKWLRLAYWLYWRTPL